MKTFNVFLFVTYGSVYRAVMIYIYIYIYITLLVYYLYIWYVCLILNVAALTTI